MPHRPHRYPELETVLDDLVASYDSPDPINNLESCALPNRRAVVDAYWRLQHCLLLGFYSTDPLQPSNIRLRLTEHLLPAYDGFVLQISRAVSYMERSKEPKARRPSGWAEEVVLDLFQRLPALRLALSGDAVAALHGDPAARSIEEVIFSYPGLFATMTYRVAHLLHEQGVPMIPRILAEHAHSRTGIDIHPGATIGERFFIDHGTGVVIGETTQIGNDVKLYQGVTLGALSIPRGPGSPDVRPAKRHPTLEDGVTVYAGATILGGETIVGQGSVVGGNVWLIESVPPHSKIYRRPDSG
ncbi:MAG: serine O-acetyltransferase [Myxococcota bacterium]